MISTSERPNVILIVTDNQNAATLGCYGNKDAYTPHIDRLAQDGIVFDNAFCPNGFGSPCRASLLTEKMPSQHGVHSWIDDRFRRLPTGWHALNGLRTMPAALRDNGLFQGFDREVPPGRY